MPKRKQLVELLIGKVLRVLVIVYNRGALKISNFVLIAALWHPAIAALAHLCTSQTEVFLKAHSSMDGGR